MVILLALLAAVVTFLILELGLSTWLLVRIVGNIPTQQERSASEQGQIAKIVTEKVATDIRSVLQGFLDQIGRRLGWSRTDQGNSARTAGEELDRETLSQGPSALRVTPPVKESPPTELSLMVFKSTGTSTEERDVGLLQGRWVDQKSFRVELLKLNGELSRKRVLEIADRLQIGLEVQRLFDGARHDSQIHLDLACDFGIDSNYVVTPRVAGSRQEFDVELVPRVAAPSPAARFLIDENVTPLRLEVKIAPVGRR